MNYGIVDIGSNTIRCNVYHVADGKMELLFSKKYTAGLASYMEKGNLSLRGKDRLFQVLESILLMTDQVDLEELYLFATASLRKAKNGKSIVEEIRKHFGVTVELLSQEEEASLGFKGIALATKVTEGISCDIGGGSSEIVLFSQGEQIDAMNLDEGSLSLFKQFVGKLLPKKKELLHMSTFVREKLNGRKVSPQDILVGTGGSIRAAGNVIEELYGIPKGESFPVSIAEDLLLRIRHRDRETISMILQVAPARIHTFTPGLIILLEVCKKFDVKEISVCQYGVREGYLARKLEERHG